MEKLRFGIMGAGGIANKFAHAVRLVKAEDGFDVTVEAVSSKSMERAQSFAERNGIPSAYGNYAEMLVREDIDAVYIATTHNFHKENLVQAIEAGKHVLCEKPMVLNEADAREVFALAEEKGVFLMEAMWSNFLPAIVKAKEWITQGRIGDVKTAHGAIGFHGGNNPEGRILNPALAGGALYDIGVYPIEILTYLIGEPVKAASAAVRRHPITGVDTDLNMVLCYPEADAVIQCSVSCAPRCFLSVTGTGGIIEINGHEGDCANLFDAGRRPVEEFTSVFPEGNGFVYEIREVIRCLSEGKLTSDVMTPDATIGCCKLYDQILRKRA